MEDQSTAPAGQLPAHIPPTEAQNMEQQGNTASLVQTTTPAEQPQQTPHQAHTAPAQEHLAVRHEQMHIWSPMADVERASAHHAAPAPPPQTAQSDVAGGIYGASGQVGGGYGANKQGEWQQQGVYQQTGVQAQAQAQGGYEQQQQTQSQPYAQQAQAPAGPYPQPPYMSYQPNMPYQRPPDATDPMQQPPSAPQMDARAGYVQSDAQYYGKTQQPGQTPPRPMNVYAPMQDQYQQQQPQWTAYPQMAPRPPYQPITPQPTYVASRPGGPAPTQPQEGFPSGTAPSGERPYYVWHQQSVKNAPNPAGTLPPSSEAQRTVAPAPPTHQPATTPSRNIPAERKWRVYKPQPQANAPKSPHVQAQPISPRPGAPAEQARYTGSFRTHSSSPRLSAVPQTSSMTSLLQQSQPPSSPLSQPNSQTHQPPPVPVNAPPPSMYQPQPTYTDYRGYAPSLPPPPPQAQAHESSQGVPPPRSISPAPPQYQQPPVQQQQQQLAPQILAPVGGFKPEYGVQDMRYGYGPTQQPSQQPDYSQPPAGYGYHHAHSQPPLGAEHETKKQQLYPPSAQAPMYSSPLHALAEICSSEVTKSPLMTRPLVHPRSEAQPPNNQMLIKSEQYNYSPTWAQEPSVPGPSDGHGLSPPASLRVARASSSDRPQTVPPLPVGNVDARHYAVRAVGKAPLPMQLAGQNTYIHPDAGFYFEHITSDAFEIIGQQVLKRRELEINRRAAQLQGEGAPHAEAGVAPRVSGPEDGEEEEKPSKRLKLAPAGTNLSPPVPHKSHKKKVRGATPGPDSSHDTPTASPVLGAIKMPARHSSATPTPKSPRMSARPRSPKPPTRQPKQGSALGRGVRRRKPMEMGDDCWGHGEPLRREDLVVGAKVDAMDVEDRTWHAARIRSIERTHWGTGMEVDTSDEDKFQELWVQVHYEGWGSEYDEWMQVKTLRQRTDAVSCGHGGEESDAKWEEIAELQRKAESSAQKTGLVHDVATLIHRCTCDREDNHPERPARIGGILHCMETNHLLDRTIAIRGREVVKEELLQCHSEDHVTYYGGKELGATAPPPDLIHMPCSGTGVAVDTVFNEDSPISARMSSGCVVALTHALVSGSLSNGIAVVRPPGHHAEISQAMGFCFFNNVGVAIRAAQRQMGVGRVLIVDWDVHHGNGTQDIFLNDPSVLYMSIHRYDEGQYYPGSGAASEVGAGVGEGYTVNIPWNECAERPPGNTEYLSVFYHVILPIAREFNPDLVFVSAGFDAADGDELGGCKVTPEGYAHMTQLLLELAQGKVILVLEGGYNIDCISAAATACLRVLLGEPAPPLCHNTNAGFNLSLNNKPHYPQANAVAALRNVVSVQQKYWKCMEHLQHQLDGISDIDTEYEAGDLSEDDSHIVVGGRSRSPTPTTRTPSSPGPTVLMRYNSANGEGPGSMKRYESLTMVRTESVGSPPKVIVEQMLSPEKPHGDSMQLDREFLTQPYGGTGTDSLTVTPVMSNETIVLEKEIQKSEKQDAPPSPTIAVIPNPPSVASVTVEISVSEEKDGNLSTKRPRSPYGRTPSDDSGSRNNRNKKQGFQFPIPLRLFEGGRMIRRTSPRSPRRPLN